MLYYLRIPMSSRSARVDFFLKKGVRIISELSDVGSSDTYKNKVNSHLRPCYHSEQLLHIDNKIARCYIICMSR